jgi:tetratricopeptide (TPR) repeat protein
MTIERILNFARSQAAAGNLDQAAAALERAAQLQPKDCKVLNDWGVCLAKQGKLDQAISIFKRTLRNDARWIAAHKNLIFALTQQRKPADAEAAARNWIEIEPHSVEAINQLGSVLAGNGRLTDAMDCWTAALKIAPTDADANANLGRALGELNRHEEAIAPLQQAVATRPDSVELLCQLGSNFVHLHRYDQARSAFDRALAIQPDNAMARGKRALLALLTGDFATGWRDYEWRWKEKDFPHNRRYAHVPQWKGSDIAGKTILLHSEQGLGDSIQFVRYAPLVAQRGANVVLQCQPEVVSLLAKVQGVSEIVSNEQTPPRFEVQCPLMSLPLAFGTTVTTIPATVPYLTAEPAVVERWRPRLAAAGKRKIGLVWAGRPTHRKDRARSIPLAAFAPLAAVKDVQFFALQKGPAESEARTPPAGMQLVSLGPELTDFLDTAAVIEQLDLLISVDTAVVHLAGAMNKPVWTLLADVNDFRWLRGRDDSPWYPSMRLWRQTAGGDWSTVIDRLATELNNRR